MEGHLERSRRGTAGMTGVSEREKSSLCELEDSQGPVHGSPEHFWNVFNIFLRLLIKSKFCLISVIALIFIFILTLFVTSS